MIWPCSDTLRVPAGRAPALAERAHGGGVPVFPWKGPRTGLGRALDGAWMGLGWGFRAMCKEAMVMAMGMAMVCMSRNSRLSSWHNFSAVYSLLCKGTHLHGTSP